jgi:hypothetical protein
MHSFQHSRVRILFEVACAFGISASCVGAWIQTYAAAFLPMAGIAGLYGLVHAFDMIRRRPAADPVTMATADEPAPVAAFEPEFAEPPAKTVSEATVKPKRKAPRKKTEPAVIMAAPEPEPEVVAASADEELAELKPAIHVVDSLRDEPEYIPATPLFETEPFLRQQRAAFGRKTR